MTNRCVSGSRFEQLRQWFEGYWDDTDSIDYKPELIAALESTQFGGEKHTPYEVLIRALADKYGLEQPPSLDQAAFRLKWFQEDAVFRLLRMLSSPSRCALLADAVGLGKTFMALGVMHHLLHLQRESVRGRPVTLIIPASLRAMWEDVLDTYNLSWAVKIVHTQSLRQDFDATSPAGADLIIIDEAHRLRGDGIWHQKAMEVLRTSVQEGRDPRVLLLTATPVNTSIKDPIRLLKIATKKPSPHVGTSDPRLRAVAEPGRQGGCGPLPTAGSGGRASKPWRHHPGL